ncbi:LOW QUALITY PROTEIN: hypothetical protein NC652_020640 [Populus alba x Populus x berolinensis]|nr:LOW QUALITY PROTEIN: hypothetical protein NC652_020640 [Populus alba x Populus x berolinensis]
MKVTESPSSSTLKVTKSSLLAHFNILSIHVHAHHAEVEIAALILLDAIRLEEEEGDECRVAKIHGLERQSNGGTVKIAIIDQVSTVDLRE